MHAPHTVVVRADRDLAPGAHAAGGSSRQVITLTWADGQQNILNDVRTAPETLQAQDQRFDEPPLRGEGHLDDGWLSRIIVAKYQRAAATI